MNAKMLNKLLEQTKKDANTIQLLETRCFRNEEALAAAVAATRVEMAAKIADAERFAKQTCMVLAEQHALDFEHAAQERDTIIKKLATTKKQLAETNSQLENADTFNRKLEQTNIELANKLALTEAKYRDLDGRTKLLDEQHAELTKLCDKVRDRMRRKEAAEEQAILNREVMAAVVPKVNQR